MLPVGINFDINHSFIEICFNLIVSDKYMDMKHFNEKEVSIKNFKEYNYTNTSEESMIYLHNLIDMVVLNVSSRSDVYSVTKVLIPDITPSSL